MGEKSVDRPGGRSGRLPTPSACSGSPDDASSGPRQTLHRWSRRPPPEATRATRLQWPRREDSRARHTPDRPPINPDQPRSPLINPLGHLVPPATLPETPSSTLEDAADPGRVGRVAPMTEPCSPGRGHCPRIPTTPVMVEADSGSGLRIWTPDLGSGSGEIRRRSGCPSPPP